MNPPASPNSVGVVLVADDVATNRELLREMLEPLGYEILMAPDGETAQKVAIRSHPDLIILDVLMPGLDGFETCRRLKALEATRGIPVVFITARDDMAALTEAFRAGGVDFISRPVQSEEVVARVRTHLEHRRLTRELEERNEELRLMNERLAREARRREVAEASLEQVGERLSLITRQEARRWGIEALVGRAPAMVRLVAEVRTLQGLPSTPVLITGESGTGKELVARAIHFGSARGNAPFVAVNCAAVPAELAESLFFGHRKGAFSGALRDAAGYLGNAHGGTLFLDEIGDMTPTLQAKLLRVLEGGTVLPVGADRERTVDVRVLAATHCDLQTAVAAGRFRADLFFRLAHAVLDVAPLRKRREDIPLLAAHFLEELTTEMGKPAPRMGATALASLEQYDFPGNVRELRNLIERALIESGGTEIRPEHLHFTFRSAEHRGHGPTTADGDGWDPIGDAARDIVAPTGNSVAHRADDERILAYVRVHGAINNAACRDLLGVGMHRAWYLLRCLHLRGLLHQECTGRWARYRLP